MDAAKYILFLDASILNFLCHKSFAGNKSNKIQKLIEALSAQEIRTESVYVSGFVLLESLGITLKEIARSSPDLFTNIMNTELPVATVFKQELDRTISILSNHESLSISSIQKQYEEHLKHQSPAGKHWIQHFIGPHLIDFSIKHKKLIREIALEILIGRDFVGFDPKELSLQFAVMYITGIVHDDEGLASPRALDKIIGALTAKDPDRVLADVGNLTVKQFQEAQRFRTKEELLDVEMLKLLMFGHDNTYGLRSVIAFTCESPEAIEARINATTGFLVTYRETHKKTFTPGIVHCVDRDTLEVIKSFDLDTKIHEQVINDEAYENSKPPSGKSG